MSQSTVNSQIQSLMSKPVKKTTAKRGRPKGSKNKKTLEKLSAVQKGAAQIATEVKEAPKSGRQIALERLAKEGELPESLRPTAPRPESPDMRQKGSPESSPEVYALIEKIRFYRRSLSNVHVHAQRWLGTIGMPVVASWPQGLRDDFENRFVDACESEELEKFLINCYRNTYTDAFAPKLCALIEKLTAVQLFLDLASEHGMST